jgi:hypothetical protein
LLERFRKGLQPGGVHGESEFAVADGQRIVGVELVQHDIVPRYQRLPVNSPRRSLRRSLGRTGVDRDGAEQDNTMKMELKRGFRLHGSNLLLPNKPQTTHSNFHGQIISRT